MVHLKNMFMAVRVGLQDADPRYEVLDAEHVYDTETGIKYHLYSPHHKKPYEISYDDEVVITGKHMTQDEATVLGSVAEMLPKIHADMNRARLLKIWDAHNTGGLMEEESAGMNGGLRV